MTIDRHSGHRAAHSKYRLTCEEYDDLVLRAEGRCDRCGIPYAGLVIDHDHGAGNWAVRGLLCRSCNATGDIDGTVTPWCSPCSAAYLANPFRVQEPGPVRTVYIDPPELWDQLGEAAGGRSRSEVLNDLVRRYLAGEPMPERK